MATLNSNVKRWENGGVLSIGSDTVANVQGGTLSWNAPVRERILIKDRGDFLNPFEGDELLGEVTVTCHAGVQTTNSVRAAVLAAGTAGVAAEFDVTVQIPDSRGASTGDQYLFADCFVVADSFRYQTGGEGQMDSFSFTLNYPGSPTVSTYGA